MKLRSSRVSKRGKRGIFLSLENIKSPAIKWIPRSAANSISGMKAANKAKRLPSLRSSQSNSGEKGANETEIGVCVDNPDEDVEMGTLFLEGVKDASNTDDKGLFLGSEVLDPIRDLQVSCPEGEIEEESVERVQVEEGNKSSTSETESQHVESEKLADNKPIINGDGGMEIGKKRGRGRPRKIKRNIGKLKKNETEGVNGDVDKIGEKKGQDCLLKKKIEISNLKKNETEGVNGDGGVDKIRQKKGQDCPLKKRIKISNLKKNASEGVNGDDGMEKTMQKKGRGRPRKIKKNIGNLKKNEIEGVNGDEGIDKIMQKKGKKKINIGNLKKNVTEVVNGDEVNDKIMQKKGRGRPRKIKRNISNLKKNVTEGVNGDEGMDKDMERKVQDCPQKKKIKISHLKKNETEGVNGDEGMDKIMQKKGRGRPRKIKRNISNLKKNETEGVNGDEGMDEVREKKVQDCPQKKKIKISYLKKNETKGVNGDEGMNEVREKKVQDCPRKKKIKISNIKKNETKGVNGGGGESGILKCKRGTKRKRQNMKGLKCNRGERAEKGNIGGCVRERVLGLRCVAVSGGGMVVYQGRGRPRKTEGEKKSLLKVKLKKKKDGKEKKKRLKDMISEKLKMRKRKLKLMAIKNSNKGLNLKTNNAKVVGEGIMGRKKLKDLLRDKLRGVLLKSGWIIDRRSRPERVSSDWVYTEPNGKSHWSITKAYAMLTKKVKNGNADSNEVSAFIPISDEEIGMLFRHVDKELGYKKKKNRKWKDGKRIIQKVQKKKPNREKGIIVNNRKPRLLVRGSQNGSKQDNNGFLMYKRKCNLLSWMIESGVVSSGWNVKYGKTRKKIGPSEGKITIDGIVCSCCNGSMGVSEFVGHCGGKVSKATFDNIYLESGVSFRKCLLDSWRKEEESGVVKFNLVDVKGDDPNDDACNICGDGGDLICCDGCPSAFHQSCLVIQDFPLGDWNCFYCSCKFCGVVSVSAPDNDKPPDEMLSCGLCEERFHQSCLKEVEAVDKDSNKPPFCGTKCQELYERLQKYIGVKHELEDGFSWTLLQRSDVTQDLTHQNTQLIIENNSKLAVAYSVMDECFIPIVDQRSGATIIRNVVYNCGSNFRRLNYTGFSTAILEKGDELITAASIRLHGSRLAEMPFIGTRHMYRRQGMCRRLLDAIESTLSCIGVEELIIPAIPALLKTWTKVFGFSPLEEANKEAMKYMSLLVFPGISMLQKPLIQNEIMPLIQNDKMPVCTPDITIDAIDYEEKPMVKKTGIIYEQMEEVQEEQEEQEQEDIILMDDDSCPEDKLTISNEAHSPYDLNFPETNATCQVTETTGLTSSESFPACTIRPCSTGPAPHQPPEPELRAEDDGIIAVKESLLTSKLVLPNTFDLNLQPTGVDSNMV